MIALVAGLGFREGAAVESLLDALARAGGSDLRRLAVPEVKARHPAIMTLIQLGYDIMPIPADRLARQDTASQSAASFRTHGTGSVAEACALAALGAGAALVALRSISGDHMATAALAGVSK